MRLGFVGLGRMGGNMVHRLIRDGGHEVVVYDPDEAARERARGVGAEPAASLAELVAALPAPRAAWIMVPAGRITDETITGLRDLLAPGDVVVDGGNSRWSDSRAAASRLQEKGILLVDAGTSGGIWGLQVGYCLMVGGAAEAVDRIAPALTTLAPPDGWLHVGPSGAGHYVKMVHNGIEYSMLQAYAEGFDILDACEYDLDLHAISALWNRGSVVRSWLLELAERAFANDPELTRIKGYVEDSGEGRWTLEQAIDLKVPAPALALSLFARYDSRRDDSFANRVIAALRNEFGGHAVRESGGEMSKPVDAPE